MHFNAFAIRSARCSRIRAHSVPIRLSVSFYPSCAYILTLMHFMQLGLRCGQQGDPRTWAREGHVLGT